MYKNGKILGISLIILLVFSVFSTFTYALAIDNNCPVNVIHILQVTPALLCLENRIDVLENTPVSAGSGEVNTASNLGTGNVSGIFSQKVGVDLQFKSLKGSSDILVHNDGANTVTIDYNGTAGSGEANTISCDSFTNGQCIVSGKVGVDLQLKNVVSANSKLTISSNSSHIIFTDNVTGESTVCSNATSSAGHFGLCKDNLITLRTLKASTGISLSLNSTDITISALKQGKQVMSTYLSVTKTNIGNAFIDIYATLFDEEELEAGIIDWTNFSECRIWYMWDYVGTGNQQVRWVDLSGNALFTSATFTQDQNPTTLGNGDSGWFTLPSPFSTGGDRTIEWQGLSSVAGDDPIAKGYTIRCR